MEAIIIAVIPPLITGVLALVGVVITSHSTAKKMQANLEKHQAVTETKLEELTREVREHNGFARRMPVVEEKLSVANHRISDLEEAMKHDR
jgi:hypothetical protein